MRIVVIHSVTSFFLYSSIDPYKTLKSALYQSSLFLVNSFIPLLSNIIRYWTKDEFSHVSIALDADLEEMYSFGRLNPYNPFYGGFVHEGINIGTFKRFKNTKTAIYSFELTDKQYNRLKK